MAGEPSLSICLSQADFYLLWVSHTWGARSGLTWHHSWQTRTWWSGELSGCWVLTVCSSCRFSASFASYKKWGYQPQQHLTGLFGGISQHSEQGLALGTRPYKEPVCQDAANTSYRPESFFSLSYLQRRKLRLRDHLPKASIQLPQDLWSNNPAPRKLWMNTSPGAIF